MTLFDHTNGRSCVVAAHRADDIDLFAGIEKWRGRSYIPFEGSRPPTRKARKADGPCTGTRTPCPPPPRPSLTTVHTADGRELIHCEDTTTHLPPPAPAGRTYQPVQEPPKRPPRRPRSPCGLAVAADVAELLAGGHVEAAHVDRAQPGVIVARGPLDSAGSGGKPPGGRFMNGRSASRR